MFSRTTISHRKRHITEVPLFSGYVFVEGHHTKSEFSRSGCVVRVLTASCDQEAWALDRQITDVWRGLESGLPLVPLDDFGPGEMVEVVDGPLKGTTGQFVRKSHHGMLIFSVEMLGVGVSVELTPNCRVESIDGQKLSRR